MTDKEARLTGSELIKKRRKSNFFIMVLLLAFVGTIFYSSFLHMQNETRQISETG